MGISGSKIIHQAVLQQPIWTEFTLSDIMDLVHKTHPFVTRGMVGGYIHRAKVEGVLEMTNKRVQDKAGMRPAVVYRLVKKSSWNFKPPSKGRAKGQMNKGTVVQEKSPEEIIVEKAEKQGIPMVTVEINDQMITLPDLTNALSYAAKEGVPKGLIDTASVHLTDEEIHQMTKRDPIVTVSNGIGINEAIMKMDGAVMPLSEQLLKIATQVEMLEHKGLKDYSTDELIDELKRRVK